MIQALPRSQKTPSVSLRSGGGGEGLEAGAACWGLISSQFGIQDMAMVDAVVQHQSLTVSDSSMASP